MSLACPCRHVSYSVWRLIIFRTLRQSFDQLYGRKSLPNRVRASRKRYYSGPVPPTKGSDAPRAEGAAIKYLSAAQDKKQNVAQTEFDPYSTEGREAIKNLITELRSVSRKVYSDADKEGIGITHKSLDLEQLGERGAEDGWATKQLPEVDGPLDVQSVESLVGDSNFVRWVESTPSKRLRKERTFKALADFLEKTPSMHESPVFRWLEERLRRRTEEKIHPSYHHVRGLKNNPWAEILASPIRACQGSGARLPAGLLLDFGYVKNLKDEKIYIMPAKLADLDALQAKMATDLSASQQQPQSSNRAGTAQQNFGEEDDQIGHDSTEGRLNDDAGVTASRRPIQTQSRLLSNQTFLRHLSDTLTQFPKKRTKADGSLTTRESVTGEVSKLIHFEAREAISTAQHYVQNKRRFEAAVSGKSEAFATLAADQEHKGNFHLNKLQWQFEVPSRIMHIMRQRILVALRALAEDEFAKTQSVQGRSSAVIPLPFPKRGMKGDELRKFAMPGNAFESDSLVRTVLSEDRQDDEVTSDDTSLAADTTTSDTDDVSPIESPLFEDSESQYQRLGHQQWLPGSIFLHIGTKPIASVLSPPHSSQKGLLPALPENNPLIPPMIPVMRTYRFPVFSFYRLFTHGSTATNSSDLDELRALLAHPSFDRRETNRQRDSDYLLLVRSLQGPATTVIEEVWRLWQYLGGENMDVSFSDSSPENV